jgi:DNA helicase-2/ATP-dependent DNA helicase PcrA
VDEERRLFYVGITRARRHLAITWSRQPSQFLDELGVVPREAPAPRRKESRGEVTAADPALYDALSAWRRTRAKSEEVPPYVVFHNTVLAAIADARPRSRDELAEISGVGPAKLERYGDDVLEVLRQPGPEGL